MPFRQSGFTLIELILVMAITASMVVIAFVGQRSLRSRAQFDSAMDKIVATVADAHNQATAGLNTTPGALAGTGVTACPSGVPGAQYVFAGVAWSVDTAASNLVQYNYYEANPGVQACQFGTPQGVSLPAGMAVSIAGPPVVSKSKFLFVRTATGGLDVCPWTNQAVNSELAVFAAGACTSSSVTLTFTDTDGHSSQVLIDPSGLAKRLN